MSPTERVREMEKMVNRLKVTFVITKFISKSRQLGSSIGPIQLDTISDGYDDGFNQAGSREPYLSSLHDVGPKTLSDLINRYQTSSSPIQAVIYEPFLAWALDVAKDFGLFAAAFFTHACAVDYIFYNVYHEVLKMPVSSTLVLIEGLPLLLELQDLPTFFVLPDSYPANVKMTMSQFANLDKADWILINTFYKLELYVIVDNVESS
ncbi:UDP-glycosyltransferase 74F2-like [Populus alba]|uniref:UDP-glycosyltransferase 74F2-like n=1 Tax=Populus alba TaxID=43335 RepID=UPI00158A278A|nr:UDP-glycosyltransferase 74F2-like [Populus alba]